MAFKFGNKALASTSPIFEKKSDTSAIQQKTKPNFNQTSTDIGDDDKDVIPKLTNAQLNKLTKVYPPWLRDNSNLKQLPGVYHGVLGQVQLQPSLFDLELGNNKQLVGINNCANSVGQKVQSSFNALKQQQQHLDYMNRFTDTERVHQLLSASQLPNETLATIWAHVNKTFPGKLTNREVCLALALIAIFQKLEKDTQVTVIRSQKNKDPFSLVKSEKKPPIPVLYPNNQQRARIDGSGHHQSIDKIASDVSAKANVELLVDLLDYEQEDFTQLQNGDSKISKSEHCSAKTSLLSCNGNPISLIDSDCDKFEIEFLALQETWLRFLGVMKGIFKRSFDILNVENSRLGAIEALKSPRGRQFSRQLCLCYPMAHNIKFKIDELNNLQLVASGRLIERKSNKTSDKNIEEQSNLFDKEYIEQIDDLMTSINEYWAVLINLFHESGQTKFIEYIMDGLNYRKQTVLSRTIEELVSELSGSGKTDVCSICHTSFYLQHPSTDNEDIDGSSQRDLTAEEVELVADDCQELLSLDKEHYYHAKCANFWLNQVDSNGLPFHSRLSADEGGILSPAKK